MLERNMVSSGASAPPQQPNYGDEGRQSRQAEGKPTTNEQQFPLLDDTICTLVMALTYASL